MSTPSLTRIIATLVFAAFVSGAFAQSTASNQAQKFLELPDTNADDEMAQLDLLANALNQNLNSQAYLIAYSKSGLPPGRLLMRVYGYSNYLVNMRGVDPNRIIVIPGGVKDRLYTEVWLVPNDADPPKPDSELRVVPTSSLPFDVVYADCPPELTVHLYELKDSLKFYAQALKENPNTQARIVVYSKRGKANAARRAKEVNTLLEKTYGISPSRIATAKSIRHSACSETELWLVPRAVKADASQNKRLHLARLSELEIERRMGPLLQVRRGSWVNESGVESLSWLP
jgi:hypothetical protein